MKEIGKYYKVYSFVANKMTGLNFQTAKLKGFFLKSKNALAFADELETYGFCPMIFLYKITEEDRTMIENPTSLRFDDKNLQKEICTLLLSHDDLGI